MICHRDELLEFLGSGRRKMSNSIRRVVTGHDEHGKAIILFDGEPPQTRQVTPVLRSTVVWTTDQTPARNNLDVDAGTATIGMTPLPGGSNFRIVEFSPATDDGHAEAQFLVSQGAHQNNTQRHPAMHKTDTIDYVIVMAGEIDMLLDEGEVHLKAGDVLVQRGTNHVWVNRGTALCRIAFVLIDAVPYSQSSE